MHVLQVYQRAGDQLETVIVAARNWRCLAIGGPCEIQSVPFALRTASRCFCASHALDARSQVIVLIGNLPLTGTVLKSAIGYVCDSRNAPKFHRATGGEEKEGAVDRLPHGGGEAFQVSQRKERRTEECQIRQRDFSGLANCRAAGLKVCNRKKRKRTYRK